MILEAKETCYNNYAAGGQGFTSCNGRFNIKYFLSDTLHGNSYGNSVLISARHGIFLDR